jgi:transposase
MNMCIYVRELGRSEGNKLKRIIRRDKNPITVRRAQVILASAQEMTVPEIAKLHYFSEKYVRQLIKNFNEEGFDSLRPKYENNGAAPTFTEEQRAEIIEIALSRPMDLGLPFTQWSLNKLKDYVIKKGIVSSISHEKIREILHSANISLQRTKTWKESDDPEFEPKKKQSESSIRKSPRMGG